MVVRRLLLVVSLGVLLGHAVAACANNDLNPQPLPPGPTEGNEPTSGSGTDKNSGQDTAPGVPAGNASSSGGFNGSSGGAAPADAGAVNVDAGDGGDAE